MSAPTPGPWFAEPERASRRREVAQLTVGGGGATLKTWRIVHDGAEDGDAEADARLIAAAPELLTAAKAVLERITEVYRLEYIAAAAAKEPESLLGRCAALRGIVTKAEGR